MLLVALVAGCASQTAERKGAEASDDRGVHAPAASAIAPPTVADGAVGRRDGDPAAGHTIARSRLAEVLDASPGYFLQHVQTEPRFDRGRFRGWRVVSFFPGDDRFAGVDLQAGDVVTRVNGKPIEEPDQFMRVWTELRSSPELTVDVERNGAPRTLRWTIADK